MIKAIPVFSRIDQRVFALTAKLILGLFLAGSFPLKGRAEKNRITGNTIQVPPVHQVTGHVQDTSGVILVGVTVSVKGTTQATSTDANGNYMIPVSDTDILVFSFIGYREVEAPVKGQTVINITLQSSSQSLSEIVVVGYGTQQKKYITGATATISGAQLSKPPLLTATQAIQGQVAGVQVIGSDQPGVAPTIRIRGTGTMLAGANPLYVVDGVITSDITNINTADIASMSILKDASSEAIYGVRAANGVIIITTKQGKKGKMQISYNAYVGVHMPANLVKMANAQQYIDYVQASLGPAVSPTGYSTNWYNQILRNGIEQNHSVSISGASAKTRYLLDLGYLSDQGIVIDNVFKRFTLRSNNEFDLAPGLTLGLDAAYSNGNTQNVNLGTAYNDAYRAAPLIPAMINGKYGNTSLFQNVGNPILDIQDNNNNTRDNHLEGSGYLEYKPVPWLTLRSDINDELDFNNNRLYNDQFAADNNTFVTPGGNQSNSISNLSVQDNFFYHWVWDNTATFHKQFGQHDLTLLAGTTAEEFFSQYIQGYRMNVPSNPNLWYLNEGDANTQSNSSNEEKYTRNSYLGRINYSYGGKYLLTVNFRADASSIFSAAHRWAYSPSIGAGWIISEENFMRNQHIVDFLKLRGSWGRVGNDAIPPDASAITVTPNLPYFFGGNATGGSAITQIKDQNIGWEVNDETDLGIEFSSLKGKLSGELGYYNKLTQNALIYVLVPGTLGSQPNPNSSIPAGYVLTNAANISNIGEEVSLKWNDRISRKLSYYISGNITFNKNNVVGLNGGQPYIDGPIGANQPDVTRTDNGHPIGSFYVQKVLGVFQNQAEINAYTDSHGIMLQPGAVPGDFKYQFNSNGILDSVYAGSYQPVAYYGFSLGITYGNFDFSLDTYGNFGNKVYNGKKAFRQSFLDNVEASTANNRWTNSNKTQSEPRANGGELPASTYFVESGSFFRVDNTTLGYTIPGDILKHTRAISSLRIYFTAENPLTIKKYSGFTAELPGTPTNSGIELNAYPTEKTYALGVNVGF
ncbi:MAG TPA: TonB-dependent receptor [Chitinophagaceae bacterium]|nr:TonB-dependent receptor [Chitinophagaceae bacterium]